MGTPIGIICSELVLDCGKGDVKIDQFMLAISYQPLAVGHATRTAVSIHANQPEIVNKHRGR
ncbi:hypothetical protein [Moorena producens]|uniref:hypothetical protein n=1 Tax=Moorena producens TaxID=1155739 RepID=UPI0011EA6266|nr:hypothetical protein [Moorena producens]